MMNQQQQRQPQKTSSPEYRSVKMASSAMAPLPSMLRSPFQQESSKSHQRTQHRQAVPSPKQQSSNSDNNNNSNNNNNKWTLCSPLPSVPAGYMLERNQIHVSNNSGKTKPQEIANRVAESLQIRGFTVTETDSDIKVCIYQSDSNHCESINKRMIHLTSINYNSSSSSFTECHSCRKSQGIALSCQLFSSRRLQ